MNPCQTVSEDAVLLWAQRAANDFDKKVGPNGTSKQKAWKIGSLL